MMKLRQKISGGFRSGAGAEDFAVIRTPIGTAQKKAWCIIQSLMRTPQNMLQALPTA